MMCSSIILVSKSGLYSVDEKKWERDKFLPTQDEDIFYGVPTRRLHHGADILGNILVVYGGYAGEERCILGDFAMFDLSICLTLIFYRKESLG